MVVGEILTSNTAIDIQEINPHMEISKTFRLSF
jgi:hypothetical protein